MQPWSEQVTWSATSSCMGPSETQKQQWVPVKISRVQTSVWLFVEDVAMEEESVSQYSVNQNVTDPGF